MKKLGARVHSISVARKNDEKI